MFSFDSSEIWMETFFYLQEISRRLIVYTVDGMFHWRKEIYFTFYRYDPCCIVFLKENFGAVFQCCEA